MSLRRPSWFVTIAFTTAIAVTCITFTQGLTRDADRRDQRADVRPHVTAPQPADWSSVPPGYAVPTTIRAAKINLYAQIATLPRATSDVMPLPVDPQVAGWYPDSAAPGQRGTSVILGHFDSKTGPAAFYTVPQLQPGDLIDIDRSDGTIAHFAVTDVAIYPKDSFPADKIYQPAPDSEIRLITCGGKFNDQLHSYDSNIVAYATYTSRVGVSN
ncbi:class F sortase [Aldersonia sp. NBC_00410]|uniref:class F sortase n=1 Tax=Aldersonia sp. NBC_00410 TaxID=2975954 RepID=UPI002258F202|nr:class F sortase [Aldersonia sp. NBC_00410]MCX5042654.1 class F sortase [Aldersonia sp. NBC_00410]